MQTTSTGFIENGNSIRFCGIWGLMAIITLPLLQGIWNLEFLSQILPAPINAFSRNWLVSGVVGNWCSHFLCADVVAPRAHMISFRCEHFSGPFLKCGCFHCRTISYVIVTCLFIFFVYSSDIRLIGHNTFVCLNVSDWCLGFSDLVISTTDYLKTSCCILVPLTDNQCQNDTGRWCCHIATRLCDASSPSQEKWVGSKLLQYVVLFY